MQLVEILRDIRFEQTLFSLPFALLSLILASRAAGGDGWPASRTLLLVVGALVAARSAAMAINRFADAFLDGRNPRTASRAVPAGRVSRGAMGAFALVSLVIFLGCAWALNPLCLMLSPIALLFLVGYSWTKRFTPLCHVILGVTLGIAPLGAWTAVTASLASPVPWALAAAVALWVGGFDVIYACPDAEVDRRDGLHSIPAALGIERAFRVSELMHVGAVGAFVWLGVAAGFGWVWWVGLAVGAGVLVAEHLLVRPGQYARMATAFFRLNAVFSTLLLAAGSACVFGWI